MAGQSTASQPPLFGIRPLTGRQVVTIALNVPGPMAAERLGALGASVVKIEPPEGDPLRTSCPHWYAELSRGMTVEQCDLKSDAGRARMQELLSGTDLLLTSQRPAALERLGLAWERLHARFPRLCQVAIVGYPAPDQNKAGHDLTYLAANALVRPPALPATLFADVASSEQAALAGLAVLLERERGGGGHYVEVALADAAGRLAAPLRAGLTGLGRLLGGGFPGYNVYRTSDGWVAVAALEPHFYRRLCAVLRTETPSYEAFAARFAARTTAYWLEVAHREDLPIGAVEDEASDRS